MRFAAVLALAVAACVSSPEPKPAGPKAVRTAKIEATLTPVQAETRTASLEIGTDGAPIEIATEGVDPGAQLEIRVSPWPEGAVVAKGTPPLSVPNLPKGRYQVAVVLLNDVPTHVTLVAKNELPW